MSDTLRTAVFLSVRDKSARLPGKVFADADGTPMIEHLIARLKLCKEPDLVVMTTSDDPRDAGLAQVATDMGIVPFRGSPEDKLIRYRDAAAAHGVDFFVVVDGDDIFCSETHIDEVIRRARVGGDYIVHDGLPLGCAGFGLRADANAKVCELKGESDTEVWGGYFTKPGMFDVVQLDVEEDCRRPDYRLTLDYPEDLFVFRAIIDAMGGELKPLPWIVEHLDNHPELVEHNAAAAARYEQNLAGAAPVTFLATTDDE